MLKYVVFPVTGYGYELLRADEEQIKSVLLKEEVSFRIIRVEEDGKKEILTDVFKQIEGKIQKEEMLFVTDDENLLKQLLEEEFYAIAFYHDRNKNVYFQGALYAVEDIKELSFSSYDAAYRRLAGLPWHILETDRLWVRETTVEDVDAFYRIYENPSITYYMEDLFENRDEEREYIKTYIKQMYGFYGFGMWTVLLKGSDCIIGRAGLSVREGYELPELGFVIDVEHQKKGYAYEACRAILNYAKEELFFDAVQALAEKENESSLELLTKLGFGIKDKVIENNKEYLLLTVEL